MSRPSNVCTSWAYFLRPRFQAFATKTVVKVMVVTVTEAEAAEAAEATEAEAMTVVVAAAIRKARQRLPRLQKTRHRGRTRSKRRCNRRPLLA